jgi:cell division protease FtsH
MKKGSQLLFYIMLFLLFVSMFRLFSQPRTDEIPYSTFKSLLSERKVKDLIVSPENIRGTLLSDKTGEKEKPFTVIRVDDPDLIKNLTASGITFRGDMSANWLRDFLLTWILPLAILMLIWSFVFKRMASGGAGETFMSFGKSRAKIYSESDVKVTFSDVAGVDEAKEELVEIIEFLRHPEKFTKLGGRIPKGVLLVGPPAPGKRSFPRPLQARHGFRSSPCPDPSSLRCSWEWAHRACGIFSSRLCRKRHASFLSTNWTRSAGRGA